LREKNQKIFFKLLICFDLFQKLSIKYSEQSNTELINSKRSRVPYPAISSEENDSENDDDEEEEE